MEILISVFFLFYAVILCFIASELKQPVHNSNTVSTATEQVATAKLNCDFKDIEFAKFWYSQFTASSRRGTDKDIVNYLNNYLGTAVHYEFAIPTKDCCKMWKDMIKDCKPGKITYYDSMPIRTKPLSDTEIKAWAKPKPQYYGAYGYGYKGIGQHVYKP